MRRLQTWNTPFRAVIATAAVALLVVVGLFGRALAGHVPGGGPKKSDCYVEFDVAGATSTSNKINCTDGTACDSDGAADDTCTFRIALCPNQTDVPGCTPAPPVTITIKPGNSGASLVAPDGSGTTCGPATDVKVPIKVTKKGKKKPGKKVMIGVIAVSSGKPKKDKDKLILRCLPSGGTTTTTLPGMVKCNANPDGGPDQLDLETAENGTDLDNGWTGVAHNFPVTGHSKLTVCLSGCDGTSAKPTCTMDGPTGAGSINGETFGPPLPLLTQGVPVCVVNRYKPVDVTGQVNFLTGDVPPDNPLHVQLSSETHFTDTTAVCPRCTGANATQLGGNGTCDSNAQTPGKACTVESIITVANGSGDKTYRLSHDCPPTTGTNSGTLDIDLKLTTGTSSLTGPTPCTTPQGPCAIGVQDDNCHGSGCGTNNCSGLACNSNVNGQCIDAKGGLSQNCCNDNPANPCFPTAGGGLISRTGQASPPSPAPPDTTYPKTGSGILVTTFCEGATGTCNIDRTTGLPGPGALILPGSQTWQKKQ